MKTAKQINDPQTGAIDIQSKPSALAVRSDQVIAEVESSPLDMAPALFKAGLERRKENRKTFIDWVRSSLKDGVDFGSVPTKRGPSKPSLRKPGAEKICGMLNVKVSFPNLEEYEKAALAGVEIKNVILRCELLSSVGVVAQGVGARSLAQDYGDLNKCLKMAEKSAHIDATLRMAGLSEIFTQDIEDMPGFAERDHSDPGYLPTKDEDGDLRPQKSFRQQRESAPSARPQATPTNQAKGPAAPEIKPATELTRAWMIDRLNAEPGREGRNMATAYFRAVSQLLPNEEIEDLPLAWVPVTKAQLDLLLHAIDDFAEGRDVKPAFKPNPEPDPKRGVTKAKSDVPRDEGVGTWRTVPVLFGKNKGVPLGKLSQESLAWYVHNFEVTDSFERDGKTIQKRPEALAKDKAFRAALDAAAAELGIDMEEAA